MSMNKSDSAAMTAKQFAGKMKINYRTALRWLESGIVAGAERKKSLIGDYWEIPVSAIETTRPKPGPKAKKENELK